MAFLPRHGRGHRISPTEIPVRANIWALKSLGVEWVISVSAVGSLREHIAPRDLVIPDQLFDRTKSRVNTFYEGGIVVHCAFANPFCSTLRKLLLDSTRELGDVKVHEGGTYVCMEGPLFSTKAESHSYRSWGMDLIGMTALPEAKLAREATGQKKMTVVANRGYFRRTQKNRPRWRPVRVQRGLLYFASAQWPLAMRIIVAARSSSPL